MLAQSTRANREHEFYSVPAFGKGRGNALRPYAANEVRDFRTTKSENYRIGLQPAHPGLARVRAPGSQHTPVRNA